MDKTVSELTSHAQLMLTLLKRLESEAKKAFEQDETSYRIIHLRENPMEMAIRRQRIEFEALKKENERLKVRLELLEKHNNGQDSPVIISQQGQVNNKANRIHELTQKVAELEERENKILDSVARTSREFREVCYLLTGYKLDVLKNRVYRLSHMYAEMEEDKLLFEITKDGMVQLLKNDYCDRLSEFITTYLEHADSFPAFLASITLDLFKSSTQISETMDSSMSMSTTVVPAYSFPNRSQLRKG